MKSINYVFPYIKVMLNTTRAFFLRGRMAVKNCELKINELIFNFYQVFLYSYKFFLNELFKLNYY